ncbi:radical SAM protein [Azospirillum sp. SYSU D00513]|uniref:radical SAM protein n=2 Tax=Pseudomonadati TaxID=3379134 RepID=UPI001A97BF67|nr:radical SAM protein [Azospirillum sp. SYSU D00513]
MTTLKFLDPDWTAKGDRRASVALRRLETLWFNTGSLCNITCANCYIESSPRNDRLAYLEPAEMAPFLDEIEAMGLGTSEIGFTGGEPFLNRSMPVLAAMALERGFSVLILTNAMRPMQRPRVEEALLALKALHGERLRLRVSLDHFTAELHDRERGEGSFAKAAEGLAWLSAEGFALSVAGRTRWGEAEAEGRAGYARLFAELGVALDARSHHDLVLFPEMDETVEVPEITTACWGILKLSPDAMMCASSRMVVKRKGADRPAVLPCTLLPYDARFEMGATLGESMKADGGQFAAGAVKLNHHNCAKFCVLGGGSCSG